MVDPELLKLKICIRNNQKERIADEILLVFNELTERFGLLTAGAGDRMTIHGELQSQVVDALHFVQPFFFTKNASIKHVSMLLRMCKDIENKYKI